MTAHNDKLTSGAYIRKKKLLVVNSAEPGITEFTDPISDIIVKTGAEAQVIDYARCAVYPPDRFDGADGVIISGSPQGNDIVDHHLPYFKWIMKYKKPILGICAGHHITGVLFGSELFRSKEPESGVTKVSVIQNDLIFRGMAEIIDVMQMHNDSISVPPGFSLLATSFSCRNQVMKHKDKPLYTCQFHPEYYNHRLIFNFIALCGE